MASFLILCLLFVVICCDAYEYRNYSFENPALCPMNFNTREIKVGKDESSSIIVSDSNYFRKWSGDIAFDCKFFVKASFTHYLLTVIQNMSLRRDEITGECIDYVQFATENMNPISRLLKLQLQSGYWGKKLCGTFDRRDIDDTLDSQDYFLKNKKGTIGVKIFVNRKARAENESIGITITFTSYMDCTHSLGAYHLCDDRICVYKSLFGDGIVNCPYPKCGDEPSCSPYNDDDMVEETELNTRLTVTAVTSIFLSFFLFLGCMMLCRYCLMFRQWHQPVSVEMSPSSGGGAGDLSLSVHQQQGSFILPPPSPPIGSSPTAPSHDLDKDLPPAYDTLFPDR